MPGLKTVMKREDSCMRHESFVYYLFDRKLEKRVDTKCCLILPTPQGEISWWLETTDATGELTVPLPLSGTRQGQASRSDVEAASQGQFRGKTKTDLFLCFKQCNTYPFFSSTRAIPLPPPVFWLLCHHMLETLRGGTPVWQEGSQPEITRLPPLLLRAPAKRLCLQLQRHAFKLPATGDSFFMLNEIKFPLLPHLHLNTGTL